MAPPAYSLALSLAPGPATGMAPGGAELASAGRSFGLMLAPAMAGWTHLGLAGCCVWGCCGVGWERGGFSRSAPRVTDRSRLRPPRRARRQILQPSLNLIQPEAPEDPQLETRDLRLRAISAMVVDPTRLDAEMGG